MRAGSLRAPSVELRAVQVAKDAQLGAMVDLLVQLVQYQIGLMLLGVETRDRPERLLPRRIGQSAQEVSPQVMCLSESGQGP